MTTYTIERKLNREWDSIWQPLETFEDKELAEKELDFLTCRYYHQFRIVTNY